MGVSIVNKEVYRFDGFEADTNSRSLSHEGRSITLTPKVFEMLHVFLRRPGEVLEKDDLMSILWPDSYVEEANLAQNVAVLRKALGENSRHPKYILTVPGRGYRFIGNVETIELPDHLPSPSAESGESADVSGRRGPRGLWMVIYAIPVITIALIAGWYLFGASPDTAIAVGKASQITAWSGLDFYPSISPDGKSVTFSSDRTGNFEIYTRQLLQGAREIQITGDGNQNFQPVFSPDGSQIAYTSKIRPGIFVIPSAGGTVRQITTFGTRPAWSPGGDRIAFQSDPLNDLGANVRNAMPPSALWIVSASGGDPKPLTQRGHPEGGHGAPSWSPDGARIVFDVNDWALSELWTVSVADGRLQRVNQTPQQESEGIFSSDGRKIFFIGDTGSSINYVPVSVDGKATGEPVKVLDATGTRIRQISFDRSGTRLAYATLATLSNIWLSTAGAGSIPLTKNANNRTVLPAFSPDGRRIVYQSFKTGSLAHLWMMNSDGSDQKQLTSRPGFNPVWAADGTTIYFVQPEEVRPGFWSVDASSGLEKKIFDFDEAETFGARPSPDSKYVLFNSSRSGIPNIWIRENSDSASTRQFTFDPEYAGFPAWSPDGKWIAMQIKRGENTHVAIMPAEGGEIIQITNDAGQSWVNSWARNSDRVIFAGQRNGIWNVYSVSRTTREVRAFTNFTKLNSYVRYPAASPVEEKVAYEYAETTGNIWVLELK